MSSPPVGPPSTVNARSPTTSMPTSSDRGEIPATEPRIVEATTAAGVAAAAPGMLVLGRHQDSVMSSLTTPSVEEQRREARRNKRVAAREKRAGIDGPGLRAEAGFPPGEPMPDFDDDEEDYQTPGSFAIPGPGARQAQQEGGGKAKLDTSFEDNITLGDAAGGGEEKNHSNLPVAFEAEVVFDYPNNHVVVAQKDAGHRTVPLKWLIIGGCLMFIGVLVIAISLGVALTGGADPSSSSSSSLVTQPTFAPVVAPTFAPVVAPTFTPVVPPTFTPVVPPSFPPQDGPTYQPVPAPTFTPVVPPTFTPVVPPSSAPVVSQTEQPEEPATTDTPSPTRAPTQAPVIQTTTDSPTQAPVTPPTVAPTRAPVVAPTDPPVESPTDAPVVPPTDPPVEPATESPTDPPVEPTDPPVEASRTPSNNPIYTDSEGLRCQCRFYTQDLIVSSTSDYRDLTDFEIGTLLDALIAMLDEFNPYPFRRAMAAKPSPLHSRVLEPTSISYHVDYQGDSLLGTAGTDPFGNRVTYTYEFCMDDEAFIEEYHDAFVSYLRNGSNRESMASEIRNAGMSSLNEVTVPSETGELCEG